MLSDDVAGFPSETRPFLFNGDHFSYSLNVLHSPFHSQGDFVDRGKQSFEVIMSLLAIKLAAPNSLHLLRGNHETTGMNKHMVGTAHSLPYHQCLYLFTYSFS